MSKPKILILGTCDTKLEEVMYLRDQILAQNRCDALVMDVGRSPTTHSNIFISQSSVLKDAEKGGFDNATVDVSNLPRGDYVNQMIKAAANYLRQLQVDLPFHGLISVGGSTGTSLTAAIMRDAAPVGFPKFIVSTMASGDTRTYVEHMDITMMYSVVDIAGLNTFTKPILSNAAGAISGMAESYCRRIMNPEPQSTYDQRKKCIGMTMFGVTTPACDIIREILTSKHNCEVVVFHATGLGGKAFELLVKEGRFDGVIDLTTTEIADELVGGVLTAGPGRLVQASRAGIPQIVSVGACDMVNFGPRESVPQNWREACRKLYEHNPAVTLMRTNVGECEQIGRYIGDTLNKEAKIENFVKVILPMGGVSMISGKGMPFEDREADEALFRGVEDALKGSAIAIIRDKNAINDREFATRVANLMAEMLEK